MSWISFISIPVAYLLGSLPSAYIVARFIGKLDIRDEADGHISAAAVFRRVGPLPFALVVTMDIGKAALAVLIAQWLGSDPLLVMFTGVIAMAGHQWSVFLKFQGGLGATITGGILIAVATTPTLLCAALAGALMYITKKSTLSWALGALALSIVLFALPWLMITVPPIILVKPSLAPPLTAYHLLIAYPMILGLMMGLKATQIRRRPGAPIIRK